MSSGDPVPYAEALRLAMELVWLFAPACEQVTWAGSLRRRKPTVSDIEIVAQPRYEEVRDGLFDTVRASALDALLESFPRRPVTVHRADGSEDGQVRDGSAYKALAYRGMPVDLFVVDPQRADWGVILTIRTGPADFSRELVTRCRTWGRRVQGGRLYVRGAYAPCPTEREFFAAVGMPWLEPEDRDPERVRALMGREE